MLALVMGLVNMAQSFIDFFSCISLIFDFVILMIFILELS